MTNIAIDRLCINFTTLDSGGTIPSTGKQMFARHPKAHKSLRLLG